MENRRKLLNLGASFGILCFVFLLFQCNSKRETAKKQPEAEKPKSYEIDIPYEINTDSIDQENDNWIEPEELRVFKYNSFKELIIDLELNPKDLTMSDTLKNYLVLDCIDLAIKKASDWYVISYELNEMELGCPDSVEFKQLNGVGSPDMIVIYKGESTSKFGEHIWKELVVFDLDNFVKLFSAKFYNQDFDHTHTEDYLTNRKVEIQNRLIKFHNFTYTENWKKVKDYYLEDSTHEMNSPPSGTYKFKGGAFVKIK